MPSELTSRGFGAIFIVVGIATALSGAGCCVRVATSICNQTSRDIVLTVQQPPGAPVTARIPAGCSRVCDGVMPSEDAQRRQQWEVFDGQRHLFFTDLEPIAALPDDFVSSSRFTSDFPCERVTRHVRFMDDGVIEAVRVVGSTHSQPAGFPIHPARETTP
jgi:hypothetical protein